MKWLKIMFCLVSAVALVKVKIGLTHLKAWIRKLLLGLSVAQIGITVLTEKINKMLLPKKAWIHRCDVSCNLLKKPKCLNFFLEIRQYKNDSIPSKTIPDLKLDQHAVKRI